MAIKTPDCNSCGPVFLLPLHFKERQVLTWSFCIIKIQVNAAVKKGDGDMAGGYHIWHPSWKERGYDSYWDYVNAHRRKKKKKKKQGSAKKGIVKKNVEKKLKNIKRRNGRGKASGRRETYQRKPLCARSWIMKLWYSSACGIRERWLSLMDSGYSTNVWEGRLWYRWIMKQEISRPVSPLGK